MKPIALVLVLLSILSCQAQPPAKELHLPEVGWTLYIPIGSQLLSTAQFDTMKRKAANAINQAYGTTEALN